MWQVALMQAIGLLKPCSLYSLVWANLAARRENSTSSWSILSRRRMSSSSISAPVSGASTPPHLPWLTLYERLFVCQVNAGVIRRGKRLTHPALRADLPETGEVTSPCTDPDSGPR